MVVLKILLKQVRPQGKGTGKVWETLEWSVVRERGRLQRHSWEESGRATPVSVTAMTLGVSLRPASEEEQHPRPEMTRDSTPEQPRQTVIVVNVDDPENNWDMGVTHTHTYTYTKTHQTLCFQTRFVTTTASLTMQAEPCHYPAYTGLEKSSDQKQSMLGACRPPQMQNTTRNPEPWACLMVW